jgi:hypothetical protein
VTVKRYDIGELSKPSKMPNGWIRCDAFLSRSGVFLYRNPDGTTRREYRPPDEVFKADALESFALVPMTNDHPPEGMLNAENTRLYQVGTVVAPRQDGAFMRSQLLVTDAKAIESMEAGKVQLSCGYTADLEETEGVTPDGERFDCIQRNIRGNHVALVSTGRAGADVRVRMDTADGVMVHIDADSNSAQQKEAKIMKIRFDSAELEVSEEVAKAIAAERASTEASLKTAKSETDKQAARADAAEGKLSKAESDLKDAPEKIRGEIKARMELESVVKGRLPEQKTDGISDADLKRALIAAVLPEMKLDGKSDAYVDAAFELAQSQKQSEPTTSPLPSRTDSSDALAVAERKYREALQNAHKSK